MKDVTLDEIYRRLLADKEAPAKLIDAAAGVANAIHVGCGAMIVGTMMEDEFRKALMLKRGEVVLIPKPVHPNSGGSG